MQGIQDEKEQIAIYGAREHNLKNIDLTIPRNSLIVITGLSGSGKSSLAFDTIYAEGQRRYMETFSAYARQFLGGMERPDVDKITGLSPVISIEQKTTNKNPRSTVGTTTEVYDFLRLLYARAGEAYSYISGSRMVKYTDEQILDLILKNFIGEKIYLLAPMVKGRKGHYKDLFEGMRKKGFIYARVDGEIREISLGMSVDRYKIHDIEVVIDKMVVEEVDMKRLKSSVATAMKVGKGVMMVKSMGNEEVKYYSRHLMCPDTGISYRDPAPHSFSFNSPHGACPKCKGLGCVTAVDLDKIIPDNALSIYEGGIEPLGKYKNSILFWQIETVLKKHGFELHTPIKDLSEEALTDVLYGYPGQIRLENSALGVSSNSLYNFEGIIKYVTIQEENTTSKKANKWAEQFISVVECDVCKGQRLNKEALSFRIAGKNISELATMELSDLYEWVCRTESQLEEKQRQIAGEIFKEIRTRLKFLLDVGLEYLSLNRQSMTLSGGESQRIRLATQIGSGLVGVAYILDEPSIGLHQRDNDKLLNTLRNLKDLGNTLIVVEHDEDTMFAADHIVDIGPGAGEHGGQLVAQGTAKEVMENKNSITGAYLSGRIKIPVPETRRKPAGFLKIKGAKENNLQNISVEIPLGVMTCVTGVSGSGKSSLTNEILYKRLARDLNRARVIPGKHKSIEGIGQLDKVIDIDQSPIGRTPRSNPATYTGVFDQIRDLFASTADAKAKGYGKGRFSFNVKGGRCEACGGDGIIKIEMHFLPDVYVPCEVCKGKRYNRETLEVKYKGKSIYDVLDMTVEEAYGFFENIPSIRRKIETLHDVGLSYVKLGQPSTTLSGGEAQRIKLATELARRSTGRTIYILDEPTTGLHFADVHKLVDILHKLAEGGNTVVVIEHNLDVIKTADYIIDMGPEGGDRGGTVVVQGTPEEVADTEGSFTGLYVKKMLERDRKRQKKEKEKSQKG